MKKILLLAAAVGLSALIYLQQTPMCKISLDVLAQKAQDTHSDAVIIMQDNKKILEWYRNGEAEKIESMSITKSIVSLAIGILIAQGLIPSINEPVYTYYPELSIGDKKLITIKHILTQTSGIHDLESALIEIVPCKNIIELALDAPLVSTPGTQFFYNNKAFNLLSGIIHKASGKRMDIFIKEALLDPLGITETRWRLDPSGTPYAMAGLEIEPADLAKIGQLILANGVWKGSQIIDPQWLTDSFKPSELNDHYGLSWWLIFEQEKQIGFKGDGYLGQYLVVYPEKNLIGVRMIKQTSSKDGEKDRYRSFENDVFNAIK